MKVPFRGRREPTLPPAENPDLPLKGCMFAVQTDSGSTTYVGFTRNGPEIEVKNQGEVLGSFECAELLLWLRKAEPLTALRSNYFTLEFNPMTGLTIKFPGLKNYALSEADSESLYQVLTRPNAASGHIQANP